MEALRKCTECGTEAYTREELDDFIKNQECTYNRSNLCKPCHSLRMRKNHLKRKYNLTLMDYEHMLLTQDNKCYICRSDDTKRPSGVFVVDHCHTTGKVRHLLCDDCNLMLGKAHDNVQTLQAAIKYLKGEIL